jgi:hypothetical protein
MQHAASIEAPGAPLLLLLQELKDQYQQYATSRLNAPTEEQVNEQRRLKDQYTQFAKSQTVTPEKAANETEDEFRARIEALFEGREPDDWTKAQRWFSMAEQFLDPRKTTMQSVAGAGQAFAQSAAEQARAQRESELNLKKGLLEYDVAKSDEAKRKSYLPIF